MTEEVEDGVREVLSSRRADGERCRGGLESDAFYRYAASLLEEDDLAAFERHLPWCPDCRRDVQAFRSDGAAREVRRLLPWSLLVAASMAAVVAFFVVADTDGDATAPVMRIKAAPSIHVAVQRGPDQFRAQRGDPFKEGDVLGFFYTTPTDTYLALYFMGDVGPAKPLFPTTGGTAAFVPKAIEGPLPDGAIVSGGEGCEWVIAVFSERSFSLEEASGALDEARSRARGCAMPPPAGKLHIDVILLHGRGS